MPYDPSLPLPNSPLESQVIRDQLQALFNLINNIASITAAEVDGTGTLPPGSPATANVNINGSTLHFSFEIPQGQAGPPFAQAVVDAVNTVDPGTPAAVGVGFDGTDVRFTFDIPRGSDGMNGSNGSDGNQGPPGSNGSDGAQGQPGETGPQGPPFAQAIVDGVSTLDPGQPATVQTNFDGSNVRFTFGIPRGQDGSDGSNGTEGAQGPPGEVSQAQLDSAINGTSANTNNVSTLDAAFGDPEMEALRQKLNELILNGRR
ncbi:MAG TPA: hypothetical protein DDZ88_26875 [Verrucomicrobiales bacterium]|nr:hypothetical protein [Verrucomicrobiales bacterium]